MKSFVDVLVIGGLCIIIWKLIEIVALLEQSFVLGLIK